MPSLFPSLKRQGYDLRSINRAMSSTRKIVLKSSDGETFEVDEAVALESQTVKHMIEDDCADNAIPLPNVTSKVLSKVIEYCKKHVETSKSEDRASTVEDDIKTFDTEFVKVDQGTLFDLVLVWFFPGLCLLEYNLLVNGGCGFPEDPPPLEMDCSINWKFPESGS